MLSTLVSFVVGHLVFALMLSVGLQASLRDLRDLQRRPGLYLRALVVLELAVPLLALVAVTLFRPPRIAAGALLVMAVCPGVPLVTRTVGRKGGDLHTALNIVLVVTLLAPLTVPAWLAVLGHVYGQPLSLSPGAVFDTVVPVLVLPLVMGMVLRVLAPRWAPTVGRVASVFVVVALVVTALVLLVSGGRMLLQLTPRMLPAQLFLITVSAALGHWAGGPRREDRITLAFAAVLDNPALALAIVEANFPDSPARPVLAVYLLGRMLSLLPYQLWAKRRGVAASRGKEGLPPGAVMP